MERLLIKQLNHYFWAGDNTGGKPEITFALGEGRRERSQYNII